MGWRRLLAGIVVVLGLGAVGYAAWHYVSERSSHSCQACARPVHAHSRINFVNPSAVPRARRSSHFHATHCCGRVTV